MNYTLNMKYPIGYREIGKILKIITFNQLIK